jgi:hypothetical protein
MGHLQHQNYMNNLFQAGMSTNQYHWINELNDILLDLKMKIYVNYELYPKIRAGE